MVESTTSKASAVPRDIASREIMVVTLWLALAAGLIEGTIRLTQSALHHPTGVSAHIIWMAPLADLVWLGVPLLLLLAWRLVLPRLAGGRWIVVLEASIAIASLLLLLQAMHKGIVVLLSLGLGWRLGTAMAGSAGFQRMARRTVPWLVTAALAGAAFIWGWRWNLERRGLAGPEPPSGMKNVILLVWDTVRDQNLSVSGYGKPTTPFLERVSAEAARFDRAIATAPWTLPSHGGMFTGRWPSELKAKLRTPLSDSFPRIAESFAEAGYATGGFIANVSYCSREHGLARGFHHFEDFPISLARALQSSRLGKVLLEQEPVRRLFNFYDVLGRKRAEDVNRGFLRWLDHRGNRPFFAFLNYFDAHQPYDPPAPFHDRFASRPGEWHRPTTVDTRPDQVSEDALRWSMEQYDGAIAYQDSAVATLMAELERRGLAGNTVVIITSDHGEHFGEHGRLSHANSLYSQLLHVPLLIRLPGQVPAMVIDEPVSLRDLPETMLDLAGIHTGVTYPGSSLARFWRSGGGTSSTPIFSEMYSAQGPRAVSLVADGYHYTKWFGRPAELYDVEGDPRDTRDLLGTPEGKAIATRMAALIEQLVPREGKAVASRE